jgi:hypothetical protein
MLEILLGILGDYGITVWGLCQSSFGGKGVGAPRFRRTFDLDKSGALTTIREGFVE